MTKSYPLEGNSVPAVSWTYEHDILGNRIRRNATTNNHAYPMRYDWDVLNRATTIAKPSGGASYSYRADGQRIEKVEGVTFAWVGSKTSGQYDTNYATNRPSSRYYYDGQMGFEDDYNPSGTVTKVTRNLLGARGIDRISITENNSTTHGYPLYDGHGSCRAILTKNGTSYGTGNWRTYDVWGSVRSGSATGDPKSRYVASIGHVADDESSLTYMRARYYEPATGRFLSEDPAMDGGNWYIYCGNEPVQRSDRTGKYWKLHAEPGGEMHYGFFVMMGLTFVGMAAIAAIAPLKYSMSAVIVLLTLSAMSFTQALDFADARVPMYAKKFASWSTGMSMIVLFVGYLGASKKTMNVLGYMAVTLQIGVALMHVAAIYGLGLDWSN